MFGIGCRLAELVVDLKASPDGLAVVKSLGRHFGNLRSAVDDPSAALLEPVTERFLENCTMWPMPGPTWRPNARPRP